MKRLLIPMLLLLFVAEAAAEQLYTAHNLWFPRGRTGSCINYQKGTMLPAGSAVEQVEVVSDPDGRGNIFSPFIRFLRPGDARRYVVTFNRRWHPEQTVQDCADRLLGERSLSQLTAGMSAEERNAVTRGAVVSGMSKAEVLVSYGPPPAHRTPDLAGNVWLYWRNKIKKKKICFDSAGLARHCRELASPNDL